MTYVMEVSRQWSQDPQALEKASELAQKALVLDESEAVAHHVMGWVYLLQQQLDKAIAELEQAVALTQTMPSTTPCWGIF